MSMLGQQRPARQIKSSIDCGGHILSVVDAEDVGGVEGVDGANDEVDGSNEDDGAKGADNADTVRVAGGQLFSVRLNSGP